AAAERIDSSSFSKSASRSHLSLGNPQRPVEKARGSAVPGNSFQVCMFGTIYAWNDSLVGAGPRWKAMDARRFSTLQAVNTEAETRKEESKHNTLGKKLRESKSNGLEKGVFHEEAQEGYFNAWRGCFVFPCAAR